MNELIVTQILLIIFACLGVLPSILVAVFLWILDHSGPRYIK